MKVTAQMQAKWEKEYGSGLYFKTSTSFSKTIRNEPDVGLFHLPLSKNILPIAIVRSELGALNGYAVSAQPVETETLNVHGGITFNQSLKRWSKSMPAEEMSLPNDLVPFLFKYAEANPEGEVYGFDCAHAGDIIPAMAKLFPKGTGLRDGVYRNFKYVLKEAKELALQIIALNPKSLDFRDKPMLTTKEPLHSEIELE